MSSLVVAAICAIFITFSEADMTQGSPSKNSAHHPFLANIRDACMLMGTANYSVTAMGLESPPIGGCIDRKQTGESLSKTFTLWLGTLDRGRRHCDQDVLGMDQIVFSCVEFSKSSLANTDEGTRFVRLYGRDVNLKGVKSIRCALFEKDEIDSNNFRLAVSGDNSCGALFKIFSDPFSRIPKGTQLLRLVREPEYQVFQSRYRRSIENSTSIIRNHDWYSVWLLG